jgi:hypothetical protein
VISVIVSNWHAAGSFVVRRINVVSPSYAWMHTFVRVRACMERAHTQASVAERAKNVVEQPGLPVPLVHMRLSAPIQLSIFPSCHLRAARARLLNHVQTSKGPSKKYNRPIAIRVTCYYQHTWSMRVCACYLSLVCRVKRNRGGRRHVQSPFPPLRKTNPERRWAGT